MHKPTAFMTWLDKPAEAMTASDVVPAAQWFVIITLATLFFLLGCFATLMWVIWRRSVNPPPHVRLLMEMAEEDERQAVATAGGGEEKPAAPWERDADWWRGGEGRKKDEGAAS
ncbi:MAG: hypothetical protein RIS79_2607 [Verrucomicrobiota bacterium]|jgi:hypothetical protein